MTSIEEVQNEIIEEFNIYDDWMDKYSYLIELADDVPLIDQKLKNNDHLIRGCQSKVWLSAEYIDKKIVLKADSDAIITKGIISLLIRVLSNRTPKEIIDADLQFIDEIGLKQNLSPTRANGLLSMIKQIRLYAIAYDAKEKSN